MAPSHLNRLLGGSPLAVLLRLAFASIVVGAALTWLDIDPADILRAASRVAMDLWASGFDAVHRAGRYLVAGAAVVVPVWLVLRVLDVRGLPRPSAPYEPLPGSAPEDVRTRSTDWRPRNGPTASAS